MLKSLPELLTKRKSQSFDGIKEVHSMTNFIGELPPSLKMRDIVNQLGKHDYYCGYLV